MQDILDASPQHDLELVMGDFNVQVGADYTGRAETVGKEALGERTENGERLLSFCSINKFKIGDCLFQHKCNP